MYACICMYALLYRFGDGAWRGGGGEREFGWRAMSTLYPRIKAGGHNFFCTKRRRLFDGECLFKEG